MPSLSYGDRPTTRARALDEIGICGFAESVRLRMWPRPVRAHREPIGLGDGIRLPIVGIDVRRRVSFNDYRESI